MSGTLAANAFPPRVPVSLTVSPAFFGRKILAERLRVVRFDAVHRGDDIPFLQTVLPRLRLLDERIDDDTLFLHVDLLVHRRIGREQRIGLRAVSHPGHQIAIGAEVDRAARRLGLRLDIHLGIQPGIYDGEYVRFGVGRYGREEQRALLIDLVVRLDARVHGLCRARTVQNIRQGPVAGDDDDDDERRDDDRRSIAPDKAFILGWQCDRHLRPSL
ncbi:hypothetical protein OMP40_12620 [Cohnella rhizosphaerae]|uniref:Uncharacterized protein n=1 Tax=Cohnella rhizosphaerae TaxID=1457232 RepID=A0A9X4KY43_9BACL|nr:hypothetical protein [Cohnella rhizosphaerae]MDG0810097.1 hypothetical protein [Cohnella rhizosphaerae]